MHMSEEEAPKTPYYKSVNGRRVFITKAEHDTMKANAEIAKAQKPPATGQELVGILEAVLVAQNMPVDRQLKASSQLSEYRILLQSPRYNPMNSEDFTALLGALNSDGGINLYIKEPVEQAITEWVKKVKFKE